MKVLKKILTFSLLCSSLTVWSFDMNPDSDRGAEGVDFDTVIEESVKLGKSSPIANTGPDCSRISSPKGLISKELLDKMKYHKEKSKFKIDFDFPEKGETDITLKVQIPRMLKACSKIKVEPVYQDGRIYVKFINTHKSTIGKSPESSKIAYEKCLKKEGVLKANGTLKKLL